MRALIVGYGTVGKNLADDLWRLSPDVYDRACDGPDTRSGRYDVAFVCVDTPLADGVLDSSDVVAAIRENDADVYVIKSTVMPGTTDRLRAETGRRMVFSPEYYGSTQHNRDASAGFTILGGDRDDCVAVQQLLQNAYDASHRFAITDAKTAELAKLMENCWIATKVSFCNQFFDVAESQGVCYEELRELFIMDGRVSPAHTYVYRDRPYWSSHCLDKDVPATANAYDAPLLDAVVRFNDGRRRGERT